jgi:uncharacterized protein
MSPVVPPVTDEATPFWDGTREEVLLLPWCQACERPHWFPRAICPWCLGGEIEWRQSTGAGTVYAVSVHHRPGMGRSRDDCPYAVALVDVSDGVRILANVVGGDPEDVAVGDPVEIAWVPLDDGRNLVAFAREAAGG